MSRNKQKWVNTTKSNATAAGKNTAKAPMQAKGSKKPKFAWAAKLPMFATLFVVMWAFLYFFYGDVFCVAEQRGFFSFDTTAMQYFLNQSLGWLYAVGRFLLLACKYPVLGTMMIAGMLVLGAKMLDSALKLRGWMHLVTLIAPFGYVVYLLVKDLNLFYLREVSWVTTIPLMVFVVCLLIFVIAKVIDAIVHKANFAKAIAEGLWKRTEQRTGLQAVVMLGVVLLLFAGSVYAACTYGQNARITCMMERKMYEQDWDAMIKLAQSADSPTRTVTGLYALALNETDRMDDEIYNIPFQYKDAHLSRGDGSFDAGLDMIVVDCNFSAGLTRSCYHEAMEQMVLEGPSIHHLKRMVQCAVVDGEYGLAEKYLSILKTVPFESSFVEKYTEMIADPNLVTQDQELACTIDLQPQNDNFEQNYREPMFLGYNVSLTEAKNIKGLKNSLYACMYSKDLNAFGLRIRTFVENGWPMSKPMQEAFVVMNLKNLPSLKPLIQSRAIAQYTLEQMQSFMGDCFADKNESYRNLPQEEKNRISKEKAVKYPQYRGTYQYYYYFQNIPDENYILPEDLQKGGVN